MNTELEQTEDQFVEDVQQETSGAVRTEDAPPPEPKHLTQESLEAAFEKLGSTITKAVTPQEQRQAQEMSPEEQKKLWAIYDPEEGQKDFMRKFFRLNPEATEEEVTAARGMFKNMQEGLVRQSVVGARNMTLIEIEKLKKEYGFDEIRTFLREQKAQKLSSEFYGKFPALGETTESGQRKYEKAVHFAANQLANQTFASLDAYFQALAERAAEFVKGILPDFDLGKQTTKNKTSTSTPRLPRTSAGGTGGTTRGGESQDQKAARGANGDDSGTLDWS